MTMSSNPSKRTRKPKTQEVPAKVEALELWPPVRTPDGEIAKLVLTDPEYVANWKALWLKFVETALSVEKLGEGLGAEIGDYVRHRMTDQAFDADCLIFDQIVDVRIVDKVRTQACDGEARAQGLYFKDVRRPSFGPGFPSWNAAPPPPTAPTGTLPSEIANAMLKAGLEAAENLRHKRPSNPDDPPPLPDPDAVKR